MSEALQERSDRLGAGQVLGQLVGDVRRIQIGKDQHIRLSGHAAGAFEFPLGNGGHERRVGLKFAVDGQRGALARASCRAWVTLSTASCAALPSVENESIATRGSSANSRAAL